MKKTRHLSAAEVEALLVKRIGKPLKYVEASVLRDEFEKLADDDINAVSGIMDLDKKLSKERKKPVKESASFPHLQMLAEAKKKKAPADDMEMDFSSEEALEAPAEDKAEPVVMGKKEILAALKECSPKDRKAIHAKLMSMVEADDAAAAK